MNLLKAFHEGLVTWEECARLMAEGRRGGNLGSAFGLTQEEIDGELFKGE